MQNDITDNCEKCGRLESLRDLRFTIDQVMLCISCYEMLGSNYSEKDLQQSLKEQSTHTKA